MFFRSKRSRDASQPDWVDQATDLIVGAVDKARATAVVPITTIARAVVYGLLAAIVGATGLVIFSILFVRLLDIYLDNIPGLPEGVWFAHLVAGTLFVGGGLLLWSKRSPKHASSNKA